MSDKSFKETIKDAELSSYRSTTKEGYVSLDPSKPLPHEFEEGKLSRYNENLRQKYLANNDLNDKQQQGVTVAGVDAMAVDHEEKIVSQYANDSVLLNKTEFREILMNALAGNDSSHMEKFSGHNSRGSAALKTQPQFREIRIHSDDDDDGVVEQPFQSDREKRPMIRLDAPLEAVPVTINEDDKEEEQNDGTGKGDIVYPNETIIKTTQLLSNDIKRKTTKPISLDAPEVDKLLNEGKIFGKKYSSRKNEPLSDFK